MLFNAHQSSIPETLNLEPILSARSHSQHAKYSSPVSGFWVWVKRDLFLIHVR